MSTSKKVSRLVTTTIIAIVTISNLFSPVFAFSKTNKQTSSSKKSSLSGIEARKKTLDSKLKKISGDLSARRAKAVEVKKKLDVINSNLNKIIKEYDTAYGKLEAAKIAILENEIKLEKAQKELKRNQKILNKRAASIYKYGKINFISVFVGVKTFRNFLVRFDMLEKISDQDLKVLTKVKELESQIRERGEKLALEKEEINKQVAYLKLKQSQIMTALNEEKKLLSGIENEVAQLEKEERETRRARDEEERKRQAVLSQSKQKKTMAASSASSYSLSYSVNGFVFPVKGPHGYSDTWGAPRSGGRTHKGTDIYALKGTPIVAVVDGKIESLSNGGLAGITLKLRGNDGNVYSYLHLDKYAAGISEGTYVNKGTVIAYVGNTGNASDGPDHLHFEIHPSGGEAVNPYPTLKSAE
ncbi:MAG: peptidoglycan DD-metalloendopeptidase family protein [Actinobacteria bacterium]|nr:peptidoglycan DD-metalloendopeptidase family protein [Actinomycetota bacterium]